MTITIPSDISGTILDIGGGGEGVISRIYGVNVIAIDNSQQELDEAPDCCEKRLMDATDLDFPNCSFDNVTFFYSLMYMSKDAQAKAIGEVRRVLKPGGHVYIWDTNIHSAYPDPHIVDLDIVSDRMAIHVSYGIVKQETQSCESILPILESDGLKIQHVSRQSNQFFIRCKRL